MSGFQCDAGTTQQEAGFGYEGRYWTESFTDNITALAGGARSLATPLLASMFNRVTTVATAADSVQLPPVAGKLGLSICLVNASSNPVQVFAGFGSSDTINGVAAATGVSQMGNSVVFYQAIAAGVWHAQGLGSGFSGANQTYSYQDGLTANAGASQATGTSITASLARFTTVASAGNAATLMPALPGLQITVINAGANIMNVYPASASQGGAAGGDAINSLAQNGAYALAVGAVVDFFCTVAGTWHTLAAASGAPQQVYNTKSSTSGVTLTGADIAGGSVEVFLDLTGTLGGNANAQLPTVSALVTAMTVAGLNPQPGMSYLLRIVERSASNTWTITTNTGWTLQGTMTLGASGVTRDFIVTLTSLSAATLRSLGTVTLGAS